MEHPHVNRFPECQECQDRRKDWMEAARDLSSDKTIVEQFYNKMLEHQQGWTADRAAALAIRRSLFMRGADAIYECDDKCGSFWQALPADPTGRNGKKVVADLYRFAIQANVVCGEGGIIRFAFIPKHVTTGGNFGLTNLLMTLLRAKERGALSSRAKTMYRHTDGGSDNVGVVTHTLHWLMVYLGIFDEIVWFRFEAGCVCLCAWTHHTRGGPPTPHPHLTPPPSPPPSLPSLT